MPNFVLLRKDFYLSGVWRSFLYLWGGRIIRICRYNPSIIQIVNCVMKLLSRPTRVILMENTKKIFFLFLSGDIDEIFSLSHLMLSHFVLSHIYFNHTNKNFSKILAMNLPLNDFLFNFV